MGGGAGSDKPGLSEEEIEEIREAFNLFDTEGTGMCVCGCVDLYEAWMWNRRQAGAASSCSIRSDPDPLLPVNVQAPSTSRSSRARCSRWASTRRTTRSSR